MARHAIAVAHDATSMIILSAMKKTPPPENRKAGHKDRTGRDRDRSP